MRKRPGFLVGVAALCLGTAALAQSVALDSRAFVETYKTSKDGTVERQLRPATTVVPGDRLVYVLSYRNNGAKPADGFAITNPLPAAVEFAGDETVGAEMSVDGGKSFGSLTQLAIRNADGTSRPADRKDVTHLRWSFTDPIPPGGSGEVRFKARLK